MIILNIFFMRKMKHKDCFDSSIKGSIFSHLLNQSNLVCNYLYRKN